MTKAQKDKRKKILQKKIFEVLCYILGICTFLFSAKMSKRKPTKKTPKLINLGLTPLLLLGKFSNISFFGGEIFSFGKT